MGVLGLHVWQYRADRPQWADELRIDLDPSPGQTFDDIREAAMHVRLYFAELGIKSFVKTTGSKACTSTCAVRRRLRLVRRAGPARR